MILSQQCNELETINITILPIRGLWAKRLSNLPKTTQFINQTARILSILTLKSQLQNHILKTTTLCHCLPQPQFFSQILLRINIFLYRDYCFWETEALLSRNSFFSSDFYLQPPDLATNRPSQWQLLFLAFQV